MKRAETDTSGTEVPECAQKQSASDKIVETIITYYGGISVFPVGMIEFDEMVRHAVRLDRELLLELIEEQRDTGNVYGGGFSAAICLKNVMEWLGEGD